MFVKRAFATSVLCVASLSAQALTIDNDLARCVSPSAGQLVEHNNLLFYDVHLELTESIAACGCKSALASYQVSRSGKPLRSEALILKASRQASFLLSTERALLKNNDLSVRLSCATAQ